MFQLEALYRLIDGLRDEAVEAVEHPSDDSRNAFGFGRVAGMLTVLRMLRERIEEQVEEANQQDRKR